MRNGKRKGTRNEYRPLLKERDVARQVRDFLEYHGWRTVRMQVASVARPTGGGFRVGEVGMPDYLYLRYSEEPEADGLPRVEALWVEVKRPGGRRSPAQHQWSEKEEARGAMVVMVDDIDAFRAWYAREVGR